MSDVSSAPSYKSTILSMSQGITWYYLFKRAVDFFLSAALIVFFSPLMAAIAIAIKLDSKGPVIFKQQRVGSRRVLENGSWTWETENFTCYKFRTMVNSADTSIHQAYVTALIHNDTQKMEEIQNGKQNVNKLVHDTRITKVGRVLRKYSMDELPQFFNVFHGEMSLVGPRPAIPYEVAVYQPWHRGRLNAQPGITGLQQITARCTRDFDDQVTVDLEYIARQSLWLDFIILLKTPLKVLGHNGAV